MNLTQIAKNLQKIIDEFSEKALAQLCDHDRIPDGFREAHHSLDLAVERCYRSKPFTTDAERLEYLFKLYEKMTMQKELK